ncbi:MAG: protein of unknown function phage-related protein [Alphaproteobacteria bacterium]|nr:protein of unknown function phage-related protein [Alphaproteobacteria bacterium]
MGIALQGTRKKLEAVARHWAGDRETAAAAVDDNVIAGMEAMGAPPEVIEEARRRAEPEEEICWVYEENWESVLFFFDLQTQWVVAGMGGYIGLNYAGAEAAIRLNEVPRNKRKPLFADIRIMEAAAMKVLNKKHEAK